MSGILLEPLKSHSGYLKANISNYRQIHALSAISKISDKYVKKSYAAPSLRTGFLSFNQYGFWHFLTASLSLFKKKNIKPCKFILIKLLLKYSLLVYSY